MRVDVQATKRMWKQTVWATGVALILLVALSLYFVAQPSPDYGAIRWLLFLVLLMPLALGACYVIRLFIESLAD